MSKLVTVLLALVVGVVAFAGTAFAASAAVPPDTSLLDLARPVLAAVMHGQGWIAAASALVLAVALARKYVAPRWPFLASAPGAALLVLLGSFGGALATVLTAGAGMSTAVAWTALKVALAAAGGFSLLKALAVPLLERAAVKWPKLAPFANALLWLLASPPSPVAKAEQAGDAAVANKPSTGTAGVTGKARDVK